MELIFSVSNTKKIVSVSSRVHCVQNDTLYLSMKLKVGKESCHMWDEVQSVSKHFCVKQGIYRLATVNIDTLLPSPVLHPGSYQLAYTHSYVRSSYFVTGCGEEVCGQGEAEVKELGNGRK